MRFKPQVHLPEQITRWASSAIWRMPESEMDTVYLTFDDGPVPDITPWVLALLKKHRIKATFFCVGENVFKHPHIFEQIIDEGHAVGNHTYHHYHGLKTRNFTYYRDIEAANLLICSSLFRPPHGWLKWSQYHFLLRKYKIIMWDVISCDYNCNITKEEVLKNVLDYTRPGSIITFHDSIKASKHLRWALPRAIEELQKRGCRFKAIEFPKVKRLDNFYRTHGTGFLHRVTG